jgi:hypothetical protein
MAQIFPRWTNEIPRIAPPVLTVLGGVALFVVYFWFSPKHTDVGYAPVQPIAYSHKLHAGDLAIDCRYCHNNVEQSAHAGVPPTQTCLNCHNMVKPDSPLLQQLRDRKDEKGQAKADAPSTPWLRIHKIPDYAYFDHSAHVTVGVGCVSCHGRIDTMEVVRQTEPLSMAWCLKCHRDVRDFEARHTEPADVIRPLDKVRITDMTWGRDHEEYAAWKSGAREFAKKLKPPTVECSGCHR